MKELIAKLTMPDGETVTVTHHDAPNRSLATAIARACKDVKAPLKAQLRLVWIDRK